MEPLKKNFVNSPKFYTRSLGFGMNQMISMQKNKKNKREGQMSVSPPKP